MVETTVQFLRSARIVLVDDDPIMRELAKERLLDAGHSVKTAVDGLEAMERLKAEPADLVISDLDMPNMTGFELTRWLRGSAEFADIPVIVITASDSGDAVDEAFSAGATSFLAKPINWTLFNHAVMFVLRASENQRALRTARDLAEAGAKFKDGLMSVMSHELRTPLNAIIGFSEVMQEEMFGPLGSGKYTEYSHDIHKSGQFLLDVINDILDMSKIEAGRMELELTTLSLPSVIDDIMRFVGPRAAEGKVDIVLDLPKTCSITADRRAIRAMVEAGPDRAAADDDYIKASLVDLIQRGAQFSERSLREVGSVTFCEPDRTG